MLDTPFLLSIVETPPNPPAPPLFSQSAAMPSFHPPITLTDLPQDVLTIVALNVAKSNPLGPPKDLVPILSTCRTVYAHLNQRSNPHLYAAIFRYQFDIGSLHRRLPASRLTASSLAAELRRRWTCLKRVRKQSDSHDWRPRSYLNHLIQEDAITAFLMLLESDGRNACQLVQYANIHNWVNMYFSHRLSAMHSSPVMPAESHETALIMWIAWLLTDYRALLMEDDTRLLNWICTPYMLGTFLYKNSFAPWTAFALPVASPSAIQPPSPSLTIDEQHSSPYFNYETIPSPLPLVNCIPQTNTRGRPIHQQQSTIASHDAPAFTYFNAPFAITSPFVSHAATLLYLSRMQRFPFQNGAPQTTDETRAPLLASLDHMESQGFVHSGSSMVHRLDVSAIGLEGAEQVLKGKRAYEPDYLHVKLPSLARSEAWDEMWTRLTGCWNPFQMTKELGMPRYAWTKGSLAGDWDGRVVLPDFDAHWAIMDGANALNTLEDALVMQEPQSWRIHEHYYRDFSNSPKPDAPRGRPLRAGHPCNAFIRPRTQIQRVYEWFGKGLEVYEGDYDGTMGSVAFYETWNGGMHGNDVCFTQTTINATEGDTSMDIDDSWCGANDSTEDDEDEDIEIIITGEVIPRPGYVPQDHPTSAAPGSTLYGTVRKWDGLVTLVVKSTEPSLWLWRGYLEGDGNFIGRSREGGMDVRRNAYEGAFVLRRRIPGVNHPVE